MKSMRGFVLLVFGVWMTGSIAAAGPSTSKDYKKIQAELRAINASHPHTTKLISIGISGTGDSIDALQIGDGPVHQLIVATHHGNEYGSTEVAMGAAAEFASRPLADRTLYVVPVLNISGFNRGEREESLYGTTTAQTADPNRDYPGPCGSDGPFHLKSTHLLADFIAEKNVVASATLHTSWPAVVYPWGFTTPDLSTPYDQLYIDLTKLATSVSGYTIGNGAEVIYPANGTFEDYAFWKHGIWSLLFELGNTHTPNDAALKEMVRVNVPGLRKMMEGAPTARATDHDFRGRCDHSLAILDRRNE